MSLTSTVETKAKPTQVYRPQANSQMTVALSNDLQIKWLASGKPTLEGHTVEELETSLSHDDR